MLNSTEHEISLGHKNKNTKKLKLFHAHLSWACSAELSMKYFKIYKQNTFHAQLSWAWKQFYNLGAYRILSDYHRIKSFPTIILTMKRSVRSCLRRFQYTKIMSSQRTFYIAELWKWLTTKEKHTGRYLSGGMTFIQHCINTDAMSWYCIDINVTLYKCHVPAGMVELYIHSPVWFHSKIYVYQ